MNLGTWDVLETAYLGYFWSCMLIGLVVPLAVFIGGMASAPAPGNLCDLTAGDVFGAVFLSVMAIGLCFGGALILALPGFILLRSLLYWARVRCPLGFALAGTLCAPVPLFLWFSLDPGKVVVPADAKDLVGTIVLLTVGALAGLVCWRVETRSLPGTPRVSPTLTPPPAEPQP